MFHPSTDSPVRSHGGFCWQPRTADCSPPEGTEIIYSGAGGNNVQCSQTYMLFTLTKNGRLKHTCSGMYLCPDPDCEYHWNTLFLAISWAFSRVYSNMVCPIHPFLPCFLPVSESVDNHFLHLQTYTSMVYSSMEFLLCWGKNCSDRRTKYTRYFKHVWRKTRTCCSWLFHAYCVKLLRNWKSTWDALRLMFWHRDCSANSVAHITQAREFSWSF